MSSVHPSYPPLDLAASGAVVVSNCWGAKCDLTGYSRNIICAELNKDAMLSALAQGLRLAESHTERKQNYLSSQIGRNWQEALAEIVAHLAEGA